MVREALMVRTSGSLLAMCAFCAMVWFLSPRFLAHAGDLKGYRISRESDHFRSVATEKFMEVLAVRPGMTILDIGTGTGQFAYAFAERMRGTGKVFATDIDNDCINYVKEEANRRDLDNLFPVLVNRKGVDEFYGRHKYDLVTVIHVPIPDAISYFRKMRDNLKEDGRLIVVLYRTGSPFSPQDFGGRFQDIVRELSLEPADSPYSRGLRESTRQLMRRNTGAEPDEALRKAIVEDFNRMLSDARFGLDFLDGAGIKKEVSFTSAERDFADYLLVFLKEEGVFNSGERKGNTKKNRIVARFNKLLFLQRFRKYLQADRLFLPGLTPKIRREYEMAGYRLDKEHLSVMPFEDLLVFRSNGDSVTRQGEEKGIMPR
jgi:protein-L-isoaspartate O-methyltransferase